jgi:hypothetical protein
MTYHMHANESTDDSCFVSAAQLAPFEELFMRGAQVPRAAASACNSNDHATTRRRDLDSHTPDACVTVSPWAAEPPPNLGVVSPSDCVPPSSSNPNNYLFQDHEHSPVRSNNALAHESEGCEEHGVHGSVARPMTISDPRDIACPSHAGASTDHHMHDEDCRMASPSPDDIEVVCGELDGFVSLQQLRARLVNPPQDDTLVALLLCTDGDVSAALKMLADSGMQVIPAAPTAETTSLAGNENGIATCSHLQRDAHAQQEGTVSIEDHMDANTEQEHAMLVWLWRPWPLGEWVAGEVVDVDVDVSGGEPKLAIKTQGGVIDNVEQGLLWPRGSGEPPPTALQDDARDERGTSDVLRAGRGRVSQQHAAALLAEVTRLLPPEEMDEDLSRHVNISVLKFSLCVIVACQ